MTNGLADRSAFGAWHAVGTPGYSPIQGAVYSADLADLTLKSSDIIITDSGGNITSEFEEGESVQLSVDIRNEGNHDATDVDIEVRLDSINGTLIHTETIDIQANSIQDLEDFTWVSEGQGDFKRFAYWVR